MYPGKRELLPIITYLMELFVNFNNESDWVRAQALREVEEVTRKEI